MIAAAKSRVFHKIFRRYNEWYLLRRAFRSVAAVGSPDPDIAGSRPVLYIMNHSSWWDGLWFYHAIQRLSHADWAQYYVMMEERQLSSFRFFRRLGAYSIDRERVSDIRSSFKYTAGLLNQGHRVLIYPQGTITHADAGPLEFKRGVAVILQQAPSTLVVPVTAYHGLLQHDRPEVTLRFGEGQYPPNDTWRSMTSRESVDLLQSVLQRQLDRHRHEFVQSLGGATESDPNYIQLLPTGQSISEVYSKCRAKVIPWNR